MIEKKGVDGRTVSIGLGGASTLGIFLIAWIGFFVSEVVVIPFLAIWAARGSIIGFTIGAAAVFDWSAGSAVKTSTLNNYRSKNKIYIICDHYYNYFDKIQQQNNN